MTPTAPPPAGCTYREALLRQCVLDDEDDTVRLVLADFLDGTGDDTDARHAELIRLQIGLARAPECYWQTSFTGSYPQCKDWNNLDNPKRPVTWCQPCLSRKALQSRESALLPALRARLLPRCWGCDGKARGFPMQCLRCSGSGVCPGTIERGLAIAEIPLSVLGRDESCPHILEGPGCKWDCNNTGFIWHPSDFARECVSRGVGFLPTEPEPQQWDVDEWYWDSRDLPASLYEAVGRGKIRSAADAARRALGRVVVGASV